MASGNGVNETQFKGWQKYFNKSTTRGRLNITFAAYGALAIFSHGVYTWMKPKKKPVITEAV